MYGRYEVEDLLKLRASPLVGRPAGLPPIEEWMGTIEQHRKTATRVKTEESIPAPEGFQRRPNLLDTAGRRSTTDPERIHLGPPRNSFASSNARSRNGVHERSKASEDLGSVGVEDRSTPSRGIDGKHARRVEEMDAPAKTGRRQEDDGIETRFKKEGDHLRWTPRESQTDRDDADRGTRRDGASRARFDQPWIRKDKPFEEETTAQRDSSDWRPDRRDFGRTDHAPEWADTTNLAEPAEGRTHEEFMKWMAKMKGKPSISENDPTTISVQASDLNLNAPVQSVPVEDMSADRFYARFAEKKPTNEIKPTKSRFASIFSAKDEPKPSEPSPVSNIPTLATSILPPLAQGDSDKRADAAAFANLLAMLNKNQAASTSPAPLPQQTRTPVNMTEVEARSRSRLQSPDVTAPSSSVQPERHLGNPSHTSNPSLERLLESKSPAQSGRDAQAKATTVDLLNLLKRTNLEERHQQQQYEERTAIPEQRLPPPPPPPGFPDIRREPNQPLLNFFQQSPPRSRGMFDDFSQRPKDQLTRPLDHPPRLEQPGTFDHIPSMMNNHAYNINQHESRTQKMPPLPPGLARPPGLDNGTGNRPPPPPGFSMHPNIPHPLQKDQRAPLPPYLMQDRNQGLPPLPQLFQDRPPPQQPYPPRQPLFSPEHKANTPNMPPIPPGFSTNLPPGFPANFGVNSPMSPDSFRAMYGGSANTNSNGSGNTNRAVNSNGTVSIPPGFR